MFLKKLFAPKPDPVSWSYLLEQIASKMTNPEHAHCLRSQILTPEIARDPNTSYTVLETKDRRPGKPLKSLKKFGILARVQFRHKPGSFLESHMVLMGEGFAMLNISISEINQFVPGQSVLEKIDVFEYAFTDSMPIPPEEERIQKLRSLLGPYEFSDLRPPATPRQEEEAKQIWGKTLPDDYYEAMRIANGFLMNSTLVFGFEQVPVKRNPSGYEFPERLCVAFDQELGVYIGNYDVNDFVGFTIFPPQDPVYLATKLTTFAEAITYFDRNGRRAVKAVETPFASNPRWFLEEKRAGSVFDSDFRQAQ